MILSRHLAFWAFALSLVAGGAAQQRGGDGPPPEIRGHIQALVKALNSGDAAGFESMAQEHFSPAQLKSRSPEDRKKIFENVRHDFGNIAISRVERDSPDAPLQLFIKGSLGASGVIQLDLEPEVPYRIAGMRLLAGGAAESESNSGVPAPQINGAMTGEQLAGGLDAYFGKMAADDVFSGNVLVAKDGKPVYEKSYGFADRSNKLPNTAATRFNLGSINKTFTQAAIQQLVARGKLALTDTVGKFLPQYPQEITRSATVDQLLHHSGGVADFFGDEFTATAKDRFRSNADYFQFVSGLKPLFAPGTREQYCNGCYIVLGEIIAQVSGVPYEKYVEENIFRPAGMINTGWLQSDGINPLVAVSYTRREGPLRSSVLMHGASGSAAGVGDSTVADLLAYAQALQHGRIPDVAAADGIAVAGGSPGVSATVEIDGPWIVIVLTNLDPPVGEEVGKVLAQSLRG